MGSLETRLAANAEEIRAAQLIRYRVFVEEMGARLPPEAMMAGLDFDAFDDICQYVTTFFKFSFALLCSTTHFESVISSTRQ